jgi:hypothetical protein
MLGDATHKLPISEPASLSLRSRPPPHPKLHSVDAVVDVLVVKIESESESLCSQDIVFYPSFSTDLSGEKRRH